MVTALYELHSDAWKKKLKIPKYNLKNLDVDFSHVVNVAQVRVLQISGFSYQFCIF